MKPTEIDPEVVSAVLLESHVGADRAIPACDLWHKLTGQVVGDGVAARDMRSSIVALREAGWPVCSGPAGYFIAETAEELDESCKRLFKRGLTALKQVAAMRKRSLPDLAGQLGLEID